MSDVNMSDLYRPGAGVPITRRNIATYNERKAALAAERGLPPPKDTATPAEIIRAFFPAAWRKAVTERHERRAVQCCRPRGRTP